METGKSENLRRVGDEGERIAEGHLQRAGFHIVERNWTGRNAEIDLVVRDERWRFSFVEVKYRRSPLSGTATESFGSKKRKDFFRAIALYCAKNKIDPESISAQLVAVDKTKKGYRITRYPFLGTHP